MKKNLIIVAGLVIAMSSLTGCGAKIDADTSANSEVVETTEEVSEKVEEEIDSEAIETTEEASEKEAEEIMGDGETDETEFDYPSNAMEERVGKTKFESYDEIIGLLEGEEAYALVKIKGYDGDVLLVSSGVYDNLDGKNMAAIDATPYTLKSSGVVTADSALASQGTAYPLSIDADGLVYCMGHHFAEIECYGENGTDDSGIMVMNYISADEFDDEGHATKVSGFYRDHDNLSVVDNDGNNYDEADVNEIDKIFDDYFAANIINFTAVDGRVAQSVE